MPPNARFTREEIVDAGLSVVRESGMDALTARAVARELGCSTQPLFSSFDSMDELRDAVTDRIVEIFDDRMREGLKEEHRFKGFGRQWVMFARDEPSLAREMWNTTNEKVRSVQKGIRTMFAEIISDDFGITMDQAEELFDHMWTYFIGVVVVEFDNPDELNDDELNAKLSKACASFLYGVKKGYDMEDAIR